MLPGGHLVSTFLTCGAPLFLKVHRTPLDSPRRVGDRLVRASLCDTPQVVILLLQTMIECDRVAPALCRGSHVPGSGEPPGGSLESVAQVFGLSNRITQGPVAEAPVMGRRMGLGCRTPLAAADW